jgi:hypothetical protein
MRQIIRGRIIDGHDLPMNLFAPPEASRRPAPTAECQQLGSSTARA